LSARGGLGDTQPVKREAFSGLRREASTVSAQRSTERSRRSPNRAQSNAGMVYSYLYSELEAPVIVR
jgi:hypothetical protein